MTKAQRIRELYAEGMTTREIAKRVGCSMAYVRVAARQRNGLGDRDAASAASRLAYRKARLAGLDTYAAIGAGGQAYSWVMIQTGRRASSGEA